MENETIVETEIETKKEYDFLKENPELEKILAEYRK